MKKKRSLLIKFLVWKNKYFSDTRFISLVSIIVGFLSGLGAVILKNITHVIEDLLTKGIVQDYQKTFYFLFPIIGFTITFFIIKYIIRNKVSHGIPTTLFAISKRKGILKRYQMFGSIFTAPITIGFGGSVGLEGPTVSTGAAISSNLAQMLHLNQTQRTLLIGCAAAGALSSIFKAPIAAIIFAIEVFSLDLTLASMLPLLLASISAIITSYLFFGSGIILPFKGVETFSIGKLPFYVILGIISGVISIYFTEVYERVHDFFDTFKTPLKRILIGGISIGLLVYFVPPLYGEGFETINYIIEGHPESIIENRFFNISSSDSWLIVGFLTILILLKIIASSITFGAGGVGGIFAPTLFMGSVMGFCVGRTLNLFNFFSIKIPESNFVLVGMAGLLSGVLHAPLTAIFLIAELTNGYELFIPLMVTSAISFAISKSYSQHSVYAMELGRKGDLITHNKDHAVLTLMDINRVIETKFICINPSMNLGELVKEAVTKSTRNIFPVTDSENNRFLGIVLLDDIRSIMFDQSLYDSIKVSDIMHAAPAIINLNADKMTDIMKKFESSSAWNLPVVENEKYLGFVSKSKLLTVYRRKLIEVTH